MTPEQYKALPPLLRRKMVVECGLPDAAIDGLRYELKSAADQVPFGRLGAVRGLSHRPRKGEPGGKKGKFLYRKMDLGPLLGPKYL